MSSAGDGSPRINSKNEARESGGFGKSRNSNFKNTVRHMTRDS